MRNRLYTIATAAVAAGAFGLAIFAGMAGADTGSVESIAYCGYTDSSNCEDDGIY